MVFFLLFFHHFFIIILALNSSVLPTAPCFLKDLYFKISLHLRYCYLFLFGNISLSCCYSYKYIIQEYSAYVTVFQVAVNPTKQWLANKLWRSSYTEFASKGKSYLWLKFSKQRKQ